MFVEPTVYSCDVDRLVRLSRAARANGRRLAQLWLHVTANRLAQATRCTAVGADEAHCGRSARLRRLGNSFLSSSSFFRFLVACTSLLTNQTQKYKGFFGSLASKNLCVTRAMQADLAQVMTL